MSARSHADVGLDQVPTAILQAAKDQIDEIKALCGRLEFLPVTAICPSETAAQARRRKRYTKESIADLGQNIKALGVMQPVIVRKLPALRRLATYELVAGERRWLGAQEAGLAHIPAIVREIADADLVAFQLSENLKRESIDALEEAEGYRDLMKEKTLKADAIAELFGMSRRHVYNRLKLLGIRHPAALEALECGQIDHSKALLIARIPTLKLQAKAFEIVAAQGPSGEPIPLREAAERLRQRLMVRLDHVPFSLEDDSFRNENSRVMFDSQVTHRHPWDGSVVGAPPIPACISCHNCSATDHDFGAEIEEAFGKGAIVCTERQCHDFKVKTTFERRVEHARATGMTIIEGASLDRREITEEYIDLDAPCFEVDAKEDGDGFVTEPKTYREVLGKLALATAIAIDPRNRQPHELMTRDAASKALKKVVGVRLAALPITPADPGPEPETATGAKPERHREPQDAEALQREHERQEARQALERAFRRRLLRLVHEKWKGPLKRDDLMAIAERLLEDEIVEDLPAIPETGVQDLHLDKLNERELGRLCVQLTLNNVLEYLDASPAPLLALAKRHRIDTARVRKQIQREMADHNGVMAEAAEPARKPANKKKNKKSGKK